MRRTYENFIHFIENSGESEIIATADNNADNQDGCKLKFEHHMKKQCSSPDCQETKTQNSQKNKDEL